MGKTTYSMMLHIIHDARAEIAERVRMTFGHVKVIPRRRPRLGGHPAIQGTKGFGDFVCGKTESMLYDFLRDRSYLPRTRG
jgi:hypothetical protein